jgi:hypothetical protein
MDGVFAEWPEELNPNAHRVVLFVWKFGVWDLKWRRRPMG